MRLKNSLYGICIWRMYGAVDGPRGPILGETDYRVTGLIIVQNSRIMVDSIFSVVIMLLGYVYSRPSVI